MSTKNKKTIGGAIENAATLDADYIVLLLGSVGTALGGIFTDSIPVLIASMVISPLASPILLVGFGLARRDWQQFSRGLWVLTVSAVIAVVISVIAAVALQHDRVPDILISFNSNSTISFGVAVIAGAIAAYGTTKPKVAAASTGVAIAVSLMPPLVATGVSLAPGGTPFEGALELFLLNVLGITLASGFTFWLLRKRRYIYT